MLSSRFNSNTAQAAWVGIGSFSSFAFSIFSAAILSRYLSKPEYGTYRQILYIYNILLLIFSAGLPACYSYFLPKHSLTEGKVIIGKLTLLLTGFGFLFSVTLFFSSGLLATLLRNPELRIGLKLFSPIPILMLPTLGIEGIYASLRKTYVIAFYQLGTRIVMLLSIIIPVIFISQNCNYAIYGWILSSLFTFFLALVLKFLPYKQIQFQKTKITYREILAYSLPLMTASISGMLIKFADQFYISRYFGSSVFADFSNGFIELPFVGMITGSIATVLLPLFSSKYSSTTSRIEVQNILQSTIYKSAILIYPLVLFFLFYASNTITLLYGKNYSDSVMYFRFALTLNFFNVLVFTPVILALGATKYYAKIHLYTVVAIWFTDYLAVIFYPSPLVIAGISVSLYILRIIILMYYVSRRLDASIATLIPFKSLGKVMLHSILIILPTLILTRTLLEETHLILRLGFALIFFLSMLLFTSHFFKLNYLGFLKGLSSKT